MSKHTYTPGPWECKHHGEWITGRDSVRGEIVIAKTEGGDWAENARLIAAAPDMLEALMTLMENARNVDGLGFNMFAVTKARAAIAKAMGGRNE